MNTGKAVTFTAGLVQMRSGRSPQANLDAAVRLIEDAKNAGADIGVTLLWIVHESVVTVT